ncbi:hypothetical protein AB0M94_00195 [Streptomyces xanthochromogenes]
MLTDGQRSSHTGADSEGGIAAPSSHPALTPALSCDAPVTPQDSA